MQSNQAAKMALSIAIIVTLTLLQGSANAYLTFYSPNALGELARTESRLTSGTVANSLEGGSLIRELWNDLNWRKVARARGQQDYYLTSPVAETLSDINYAAFILGGRTLDINQEAKAELLFSPSNYFETGTRSTGFSITDVLFIPERDLYAMLHGSITISVAGACRNPTLLRSIVELQQVISLLDLTPIAAAPLATAQRLHRQSVSQIGSTSITPTWVRLQQGQVYRLKVITESDRTAITTDRGTGSGTSSANISFVLFDQDNLRDLVAWLVLRGVLIDLPAQINEEWLMSHLTPLMDSMCKLGLADFCDAQLRFCAQAQNATLALCGTNY